MGFFAGATVMLKAIRRLRQRKAASTVEYGLILGLIAVACLGAVALTGERLAALFGMARNGIQGEQAPGFSFQEPVQISGDTDPAVTVTVLLHRAPGAEPTDASVHVETQDGSAIAGTDYTATGVDLSFPIGTESQSLTVAARHAAIYGGPPRVFRLVLSQAQGAGIAQGSIAVTLPDRVAPPTVAFAEGGPLTVAEGADAQQVELVLSPASASSVSVPVQLQPGSASANDLEVFPATGGAVTFAPQQTSATLSLRAPADTDQEALESAQLVLGTPTGAALGDPSARQIDIPANGQPPTASLYGFAQTPFAEGEDVVLTVALSGHGLEQITVPVIVTDIDTDAGDWALADGSSDSFTFTPTGPLTQSFTLHLNTDAAEEQEERLQVALGTPTGATTPGSDTAGTVAIAANGSAPLLTVDTPAAPALAEGAAADIGFHLSNPSWRSVSVPLVLAGDSTAGAEDVAFTVDGATVTAVDFAPGETDKTLHIAALADGLAEGAERLHLAVAAPEGLDPGSGGDIALDIGDGDAAPVLRVSGFPTDPIAEGDSVTLTVALSGRTVQAVTATLALTNAGTDAADWTISGGSTAVSFPAGTAQLTQTVTIEAVADSAEEQDERLDIALADASGAAIDSQAAGGTIRIAGNGAVPVLTLQRPQAASLAEGASAQIGLHLSNPSWRSIAVTVAPSSGSVADSGDYTAAGVTFAPGETDKTVTLQALDDGLREGDEQLVLAFATDAPVTFDSGGNTLSVLLTDAQAVPTVSLGGFPSAPVAEGGSVTLTATLSGRSAQAVSVPFSIVDGTTTAADRTLTAPAASPLVFAAGTTTLTQTIVVAIADDGIREAQEDFQVQLGAPTGAALGAVTSGIVSIAANGTPPALTVGNPSATTLAEGGAAVTFALHLDHATFETVTVPVALGSGSTATAADLGFTVGGVAANGNVVFQPGDTDKVLSVAAVNDSLYEGTETAAVAFAAPTGATGSATSFTLSITDAQSAPALTFTQAKTAFAEGSDTEIVFTVTRPGSSAVATAVTFDYSISANGATNIAADSNAAAKTLTIPASTGTATGSIRFTLADDARRYNDGTASLSVTLSGASNAGLPGGKTLSATVTDNDRYHATGNGSAASPYGYDNGYAPTRCPNGQAASALYDTPASTGVFTVNPDGAGTVPVYCSGTEMLIETKPGSAGCVETMPVLPDSTACQFAPRATVQRLAAVATQVHLDSGPELGQVTSSSGGAAIQALRSGSTVVGGDGTWHRSGASSDLGGAGWSWVITCDASTGPDYANPPHISSGIVGWPNMYHACGNAGGVHWNAGQFCGAASAVQSGTYCSNVTSRTWIR